MARGPFNPFGPLSGERFLLPERESAGVPRARLVYREACPNCEGEIEDVELQERGLCAKCLSEEELSALGAAHGEQRPRLVLEVLSRKGRLGPYARLLELELRLRDFLDFFSRVVGHPPWALQRTWAKRLISGRSFSMLAPTGYGKSTFGLAFALYLALGGRRSYIIAPTALLVQNLADRARAMSSSLPRDVRILAYHSGLSSRQRQEVLRLVDAGAYDVLLSTDRFLYRRAEVLSGHRLSFIFVDDVESFLRSPLNIDRVLILLGFTQQELSEALEAIKRGVNAEPRHAVQRGPLLVLSGSTLRQRGLRLKLFRHLLGFEPASVPDLARNVANFYMPSGQPAEATAQLIARHGPGCLVFTPLALGREFALALAEELRRRGIRARAYERPDKMLLAEFTSGGLEALVGIASTRGPLAKGLDLPASVRYAIFAGVPRREFRIPRELKEASPRALLAFLKLTLPLLDRQLTAKDLRTPQVEGLLEKVKAKLVSPEAARRLREAGITLRLSEDEIKLTLPDVAGYLQGSGRTSRLFWGGLTRGISILLVDDEEAFAGLAKRLKVVAEEVLEPYEEAKVAREFSAVDRDRSLLRDLRRGGVSLDEVGLMVRPSLVIVESPTKAKAIASFFGRPARKRVGPLQVYETASGSRVLSVAACQGHVYDLTTGVGLHGVLMLDGQFMPLYSPIKSCRRCGHQFTDAERCPRCGSPDIASKKELVQALRQLAWEAEEVLIATDPDTEGEKIAYDLACQLRPYASLLARLEFHEVTKRAFISALAQPRQIALPRVEAQLVRRIEDRWIGFGLSQELWRAFGRTNLSAGRVQGPVLGWIVLRTEELREKVPYLWVSLENGLQVNFAGVEGARELASRAKGGLLASVSILSSGEKRLEPLPPFTTDSLLREANRMGFDVGYAMNLAQDLFEAGLITYHRTDATRVSEVGLEVAKQYLLERGLAFAPRRYELEGAHECIRPTKPLDAQQLRLYLRLGLLRPPIPLGADHLRLYDLIFRRFMASQMEPAVVECQELLVRLEGLEARKEVWVRPLGQGFLALFSPALRFEGPYHEGTFRVKDARAWLASPVKPYTQADVVALMKERGIGRPSTYSKILEVLLSRGYVVKKGRALLATRLGRSVYSYLRGNFGPLISEERTRRLEGLMDAIERGEARYLEVLGALYQELQEVLVPLGQAPGRSGNIPL